MTIPTTQRISGPAELVQAIPYLLGFHPTRSLVLVGLDAGVLVVTARLDLPDVLGSDAVRDTVGAMAAGGASTLVAAVYDDAPGLPASLDSVTAAARILALLDVIAAAAERHGCDLLDALCVAHGRWRSAMCAGADCCPADGEPLPDAPSAFAAAATVAGVVALPDRQSLARSLEPAPLLERSALLPAIAEAERAALAAGLGGQGAQHGRSAKRAIFAAARAADTPGWAGLAAAQVARFAVSLADNSMRDAVWAAVDHGRLDGRPLWRELARRAPAPYDAPPLLLFGWASWRAGDGALAGIAAERAVASDPSYSAADLLLGALSCGVNPNRLPRLRSHGRGRASADGPGRASADGRG
ncbi:DUF4192 domain-containing protein [uncultured Jatrophihabitans sp.]|uniref:DUF4192 domain-containing protein n=1 Tax=uncultured Jatrophihabitans sp. TaxID=1610747 RepID=UPI0035CA7D93